MANYSYVMAEFDLIKEGVLIYPPKEVVQMILETSVDEGFQNDDMSFHLAGRWTYDNNLKFIEMQAIITWLRKHNYEGMVIHYAEYEEGADFVGIARATYTIKPTVAGSSPETDLKIESTTWSFEEFSKDLLGMPYPDLDDYEDDEDGEPDYDRYTEECDHMIELILHQLEHQLGEKEELTFVHLETSTLPV